MKSDVYFLKTGRIAPKDRAPALKKFLGEVGRFMAYKKNEILPVKITIGDSACVYNVSPDLVKLVVSHAKEGGAKPFLFDTSVIYQGERQNAVDHTALAQKKGFGYQEVGAPFIVADGLLGNDGKDLAIAGPDIQKVRAPSFVGLLDSLLVLSHPTGHIVSVFAGAIKNVAMGMSCRATKQVQHSSLKPSVITKKCAACGCCMAICPREAITLKEGHAFIEQRKCVGCGECLCACKFNAIYINWEEDPHVFCRRLVDVADIILKHFKNKFFISFAFDITKECDCISNKSEKMVSDDLGILASGDILSLDKATADLSGAFKNTIPETLFEYAAKKGLGNLEYNKILV